MELSFFFFCLRIFKFALIFLIDRPLGWGNFQEEGRKKDRSAIVISMGMRGSNTANGVLAAETEELLDTGRCGW